MNADTPHASSREAFTHRRTRIIGTPDPPGLRIEGDLDRTVLATLTQALAAHPGPGEVSLDLTRLDFIDVGCLRTLVTATLVDGRVLTLHSMPPNARRLLELTGWHDTPHLRLNT
ncbi:STAS domain-containing protein [Sphaerisporangium aureirubrum]|uniref:STAS domain-containing protein n=1 Tax=Sphaerisporangium aureirubrum TaxID=1544736 RepID=A0ABW1NSX3_9ACTN